MTDATTSPTDTAVTHFKTCPLCEAMCGLAITVEGGAVTHVRGDADDVFSQGFICPKGAAIGQLHDDPDRLRAPRVKGDDGAWREVSWGDAFKAVDEGLRRVRQSGDRDALGVYLGNPNVHNLGGTLYVRPLLKTLGTRNIFSASTVDQMPRHVSCGLMFGSATTIPVPDLDRADYLLMLGANPWQSNGSLCTAPDFPGRLKALRARGGRLVVVDPRRSKTARRADEHLFIRPGTDVFLLVAMIHTLFEEGLVDPGAAAPHLKGLDEVRELVRPFSPDAVAPTTGIDADTTRRLARELAGASRAVVYGRIGVHTVPFGTLSSWACDVLTILTGNLDQPGGAMFPMEAHGVPRASAGGRGFQIGRWRSRVRQLPEALGELPVATLADEIETEGPGQIRALLTVAGNPVRSTPNSARLDAALASLDFMVSVDPYLNATTRHADVILPPPSPLERPHYDLAFAGFCVRNVSNYSPPIFQTQGPSECEILARLTLILAGQGPAADTAFVDAIMLNTLAGKAVSNPASPAHGRALPEVMAALGDRQGPERILDLMLRAGPYGDGFDPAAEGLSMAKLEANPHGIDLGPLKPRLPEVLKTPDGKVAMAPQPIVDDFDRLRSALSAEVSDALRLVGRRHLRSNNSWMHNVPLLVRGKNRCTLLLHPDDAAAHGIGDGDRVVVTSRVGSVEAPAEITEDIMPGVVSLPHGWGHDVEGIEMSVAAAHPGVNSNQLTDEASLDALSGNATLNAIPVTIALAI